MSLRIRFPEGILDKKSAQHLRIFAVGDVIGRPGRRFLEEALPRLKKTYDWDVLIVNVENAAGGFGMTPEVYEEFQTMGVDCMTSGNHIFDKKGYETWMPDASKLLRPFNMPPGAVGQGVMSLEHQGTRISVLNLIGRTFMKAYDCPFRGADTALKEIESDVIIVDFHGEATSEKMALGHYLSKRVSLMWGTHTHVPTADARILDGHTGYLTDLGMTGPYDSVIGMKKEPIIESFISLERSRFEPAKDDVRIGGCIADIDRGTGACTFIQGLFLSEDDLER